MYGDPNFLTLYKSLRARKAGSYFLFLSAHDCDELKSFTGPYMNLGKIEDIGHIKRQFQMYFIGF